MVVSLLIFEDSKKTVDKEKKLEEDEEERGHGYTPLEYEGFIGKLKEHRCRGIKVGNRSQSIVAWVERKKKKTNEQKSLPFVSEFKKESRANWPVGRAALKAPLSASSSWHVIASLPPSSACEHRDKLLSYTEFRELFDCL